jgi:hypothetical protein
MIGDVHPGSGFRIRILIFYTQIRGSKRRRNSDPNPQDWFYGTGFLHNIYICFLSNIKRIFVLDRALSTSRRFRLLRT